MTEAEKEKSLAVEENVTEEIPAELRESRWSVISFEKCEMSGLTYTQAEQILDELQAQKVSGLCIVTDNVAARIAEKK